MVESRHHGSVVGLNQYGSVAFAIGHPEEVIYPRSAIKPLQATAMVRCGLALAPDLLAVVCASHSGEERHRRAVEAILRGAGLGTDALQNTPDWALDQQEARRMIRADERPSSLAQNCSGKHAGMLATAVVNGWPWEAYRELDHPLQRAITEVVAEATGEEVGHTGVDGCGAPAPAVTLVGLARAMRHVATAPAGTAERRVVDAMRAHPAMVGGTGRDVTLFMQRIPGLVAKDGAEAVFAIALRDGRALALKIEDGANRPRVPLAVAALARLGVDVSTLLDLAHVAVYGHGEEVGLVRPVI